MTTTKKPKKASPRKIKVGDEDEWVEREPKRHIPGVKGGPPPSMKPKPSRSKSESEPNGKRISALNAAAQVLLKAKAAMTPKEIVQAMVDQGLWSSAKGKTPHATLYSAMIREIKAKGRKSRFERVDTKFAATRGDI